MCFQLYGRHKEYLSGLVGSEFEMVSTGGTGQRPGAPLPLEAVGLVPTDAVCTAASNEGLILRM